MIHSPFSMCWWGRQCSGAIPVLWIFQKPKIFSCFCPSKISQKFSHSARSLVLDFWLKTPKIVSVLNLHNHVVNLSSVVGESCYTYAKASLLWKLLLYLQDADFLWVFLFKTENNCSANSCKYQQFPCIKLFSIPGKVMGFTFWKPKKM